jgi:hypothetical protein
MAENQYVNKVVFGNTTVMDISDTTADPTKVLASEKFYDRSGAPQTGACTFDADTSDANATAAQILSGTEQNPITAYVNGNKITGAMPNRGGVTGTISTVAGTYSIQNGYHDGSGTVAIDSTEQAKIVAGNIKKDVTILGVTGTYEGSATPTSAAKTVTPYTTSKTYLPSGESTPVDYYSQVTVNAISYVETDNAQGGKTVTIGDIAPV